jgi:hypothetical protein
MRLVVLALLAAAAALSAQTPPAVAQETAPVAAFARLYGVVRYFYPGDAAAALDWNRFAVHGVGRVRSASDPSTLASTLNALFTPLGPGIRIGTAMPPPPALGAPDPGLIAWRYQGPGGMSPGGGPYSAVRTNRGSAADPNVFVTVAQPLPIADLRGRTIRLRARARVVNPDAAGWTGMWLRVDRPNQQVGFFDNMQNRPIRTTEWTEYVIEGAVADDAVGVIAGPLTSGEQSADYDAFELSALVDGAWTPVAITNAGFEEGTGDQVAGWQRGGNAGAARVTVGTTDAPEGVRHLRLTSVPGTSAVASLGGAVVQNAFVDVDLGSGLVARVRLSLTDSEARAVTPELEDLRQVVTSITNPHGRSDRDVRLADVVVAWNILRHFYPYWEEAGVDWDDHLAPHLSHAVGASTRDEHHDALRMLVADIRDGHGTVNDAASGVRRGVLPIQLTSVDGQIAISGTNAPDRAPIGAVVTTIDGRPSGELLERGMRLASGTPQWRQARTLRELAGCVHETTVSVRLQLADGQTTDVALPCAGQQLPIGPRPEPIAELASGTWYVDLTRATMAQVQAALPSLASATGLVFDVRGYPTDAGAFILRHLVDAPESARWMHVPNMVAPFGQADSWLSVGWNVQPATPHLGARRVFLTDGRAISYAESVMGYVGALKLGTIIGGATAGANGNVASAVLPGGFSMIFTGMRVTRHDGRAPFHLIGVLPDIALQPTLAGLRAGRDEVLERALQVLGTR